MKICVTGSNGFIGSGLINRLQRTNQVDQYVDDVRDTEKFNSVPSMDILIHLACPSDRYGFKNRERLATSLVDGTINAINVAKKHNAILLYASTMGVYQLDVDTMYRVGKLAMEQYIQSVYTKYIILRIPRVYDMNRDKGLMKMLKMNQVPESDMNNMVEFTTLANFLDDMMLIIEDIEPNLNKVIDFKSTHTKTIKEIKEWLAEY